MEGSAESIALNWQNDSNEMRRMNKTLALISPLLLLVLISIVAPIFAVLTRYSCGESWRAYHSYIRPLWVVYA